MSEECSCEVISVGMEKLYEDPEKFARQEEEFFDFIWSVLRPQ